MAWQEFNRSIEITMKREIFKTKQALDKFVEKLYENDNFWNIYGVREG